MRLDFVSHELIDRRRGPVLFALDQLLKVLPELFEGLDVFLANFQEGELFGVELKVDLLLVDELVALSQLLQLVFEVVDLNDVVLAALGRVVLFELVDLGLNLVELDSEVFAFLDEASLDVFPLHGEVLNSVFNLGGDALHHLVRVLHLLLDLLADLILWVVVHQLHPLDEVFILGNDFVPPLASDFVQVTFHFDELG